MVVLRSKGCAFLGRRQSLSGSLELRIEAKGHLQPAQPFFSFPVRQEEQPRLTTQTRVIGPLHHLLPQPIHPSKVLIETSDTGVDLSRLLRSIQRQETTMEAVGNAPIVGTRQNGLTQPGLRILRPAAIHLQLTAFPEGLAILRVLGKEFGQQRHDFFGSPQKPVTTSQTQFGLRPFRAPLEQPGEVLQRLLGGLGDEEGLGEFEAGLRILRVGRDGSAIILQRVSKIEKALPDMPTGQQSLKIVGATLQITCQPLERLTETVRVDVVLNQDFEDDQGKIVVLFGSLTHSWGRFLASLDRDQCGFDRDPLRVAASFTTLPQMILGLVILAKTPSHPSREKSSLHIPWAMGKIACEEFARPVILAHR